jgi:hypothetical protein
MARALNGLFGKITGKIGDFTVRNVKGKTVVSARPSHYNVSNSLKSIESRGKFTVTVAFSKVVNGLSALQAIWNIKNAADASEYQTIFKYNFNLSSSKAPTLNNIITPNGSWSPVIDVSINTGKLIGSLAPFDTQIEIKSDEAKVSINAVVSLSDPKNADDPYLNIFALSKVVADFNFSEQYDFEIGLNPEAAANVAKYNQKIIYLAVAIKSKNNEIFCYSKSYSKMIE